MPAEFPNFAFHLNLVFNPPSTLISEYLQSFELRAFRQILPSDRNSTSDTADIFVANTDLYSAILQYPSNTAFNLTIINNPLSNSTQIGSTEYYYSLNANDSLVCHTLFFNNGYPTQFTGNVYPNPLKLMVQNNIFFPAPPSAALGETVSLTILSPDMVTVYSGNLYVVADEQKRVLILNWRDISQDLLSGVYIYSVKFNNEQLNGKFAVIR